MSGIDGCYYCDDEGFEYQPGTIFSLGRGSRGGKRKDEFHDRQYWQLVSLCLQEFHGLGAYQARKKIYELEERFMGASSKVIEIIYHDEPIGLSYAMMDKSPFRWAPGQVEKYQDLINRVYGK